MNKLINKVKFISRNTLTENEINLFTIKRILSRISIPDNMRFLILKPFWLVYQAIQINFLKLLGIQDFSMLRQ